MERLLLSSPGEPVFFQICLSSLPFKIRVETVTLEVVVIPEDIQEQIFLVAGGRIYFPMASR